MANVFVRPGPHCYKSTKNGFRFLTSRWLARVVLEVFLIYGLIGEIMKVDYWTNIVKYV